MNDTKKQLTLEGFMKLRKLRNSYSRRIEESDKFMKERRDLMIENCTPTKMKKVKRDTKNSRLETHRKLLLTLKRFPGLYDKSHPGFNVNKERTNNWAQLINQLDLKKSPDLIKCQINKLIKKYKVEKENPNSTWELLDDARFLEAKFKDDPTGDPEDELLIKPILKNNIIDDDDEESGHGDSANNAVSSSNVHVILDSSDEDEYQNNDVNNSGVEWPSYSPPKNEPKILSHHSDVSTQREIMNPENDSTFPDAGAFKQEMEIILSSSQVVDYSDNQSDYLNQLHNDDNEKNKDNQVASSSSVDLGTNLNHHYEVNSAFAKYILEELNNQTPLVAYNTRKRIIKNVFSDY